MTKSPKIDFEKSLTELEEVVAKLESGELSLDQSLSTFKRGIELARQCQQVLDTAQITVDQLLNTEHDDSEDLAGSD